MRSRLFATGRRLALGGIFVACVSLLVAAADAASGDTERVSVSTGGSQGNDRAYWPSISADGRYVAFESTANNLVPDDTGFAQDIFVHDRLTGTTERVSVATDGTPANDYSFQAAISPDGQYVAFMSYATNLVEGDTNNKEDIFVHSMVGHETVRISMGDFGATEANGNSEEPSISATDRYYVFQSDASNLVTGDTNGKKDIFLYDLWTHMIRRVSVAFSGSVVVEGNDNSFYPQISADGRFVAFQSSASNLVANDTNNAADVFVYDNNNGVVTSRASIAPDGSQFSGAYWPSIGLDGRYVTFTTGDIYVRDQVDQTTTRVSVGLGGAPPDNDSGYPVISTDNSAVAFTSYASNLVTDDTNGQMDTFVYNRLSGQTTRVSVAFDGTQENGPVWVAPAISSDGDYVAFASEASNLVPDDTNGAIDVFVHDLSDEPTPTATATATTAPTATRTPTPTSGTPGAVGGIAEPPDNLGSAAGSGPPVAALAAIAVAAFIALGLGGLLAAEGVIRRGGRR